VKPFAERPMSGALAVVLDSQTAAEERTDAAWVIRGLLARVAPTGALMADVGRAFACNLDAPGALARLLVVLRAGPVYVSRTKSAVARAAELAFPQERLPGLQTQVLVAFDDPAWSELACNEYGAAASAWAISDLPARRTEALMLLGGWILLPGSIPEWQAPRFFVVLPSLPRYGPPLRWAGRFTHQQPRRAGGAKFCRPTE
jgi:hypothetical protein